MCALFALDRTRTRLLKRVRRVFLSLPLATTVPWLRGAASNEGWILTVEDPEGFVRFTSPTWTAAGQWKLRITYEPK